MSHVTAVRAPAASLHTAAMRHRTDSGDQAATYLLLDILGYQLLHGAQQSVLRQVRVQRLCYPLSTVRLTVQATINEIPYQENTTPIALYSSATVVSKCKSPKLRLINYRLNSFTRQ